MMKTKSLLFAAAVVTTAVLLTPSQAQAGGNRNGYRNYRDCGYENYRGYRNFRNDCYAPVRQVRVVRPMRYRPVDCAPAPVFRISFGFGGGGGRCY